MAMSWKALAIGSLILAVLLAGVLGTFLGLKMSDLSSTQTTLALTQNKLDTTQNTLESTQSQLKSTQDTLTSTTADLTATKDTLSSTQTQLTTTKNTLTTTSQQLADIQKVYPLKYFSSYSALRTWLDVSLHKLDRSLAKWYQAKKLSELAAADGYYWSLGVDSNGFFITTVIAGDSIYWVYIDGTIENSGYLP